MKRFVTILLLAIAAVLTTCTPCEAKKGEVVVALIYAKSYLYEDGEFEKESRAVADSAIRAVVDMPDEYKRMTYCDNSWMIDVYLRKMKFRDIIVLECYCSSPVCYDDYRPDATEFFERLQDEHDESFRSRYKFNRQVVLK